MKIKWPNCSTRVLFDASTRGVVLFKPMQFLCIGLGNHGDEYDNTRHNVGFAVLDRFSKEWTTDKYLFGDVAKVKVGTHSALLLKPSTFMNKSGLAAVAARKASAIPDKRIIVIHDDLDLPLGSMKIVFDRGSGGHRGVESVVHSLKTQAFIRVRLGISPTTPSGKLKKPKGDAAVQKFILGTFSPKELLVFKKATKRAQEAIELLITDGLERAMNEFN